MPNWVTTRLVVTGDPEHVENFQDRVVDNRIFRSLDPTPPELYEDKKAALWYAWQVERWGTKWGDCMTKLVSSEDGELVYSTQFAWTIPSEGMCIISALFPALVFTMKDIREEFDNFSGEMAWQAGKILYEDIH